jgi:hypothetical protein
VREERTSQEGTKQKKQVRCCALHGPRHFVYLFNNNYHNSCHPANRS